MSEGKIPFKELLGRWKMSLPGRAVPIPNKGEPDVRIQSYWDLFELLLQEGYTPEEIKFSNHRAMVINASHNPNHRDHKKGTIWKNLAEEDFDMALIGHNKITKPINMPKYDPSQANVITPEARPYTPSTPKLDQVRDQTEELIKQANEPTKPAVEYKELTEEQWAKVPVVNPVYDEELSALLGFNDE